jgi:hypothetical protein
MRQSVEIGVGYLWRVYGCADDFQLHFIAGSRHASAS